MTIRFFDRFGVTRSNLDRLLSMALRDGGDYADVYLENRSRDLWVMEEGIVKNASRNISQGLGIRVIVGERTGYAYADGLEWDAMLRAARTAGAIAKTAAGQGPPPAQVSGPPRDLYPVETQVSDLSVAAKIQLLEQANREAMAYDPRIVQARVVLANEDKEILVYGSRGDALSDRQPLTVFQISAISEERGQRQIGIRGGGGRVGLDFFDRLPPSHFAREASRQAITLLDAREAPAGTMPVVLGPGWPGILLHEAVGHGLEADFNRKNLSAFAGRVGHQVASEHCTVVDDGTIPGRRGSLNIDDEGHPSGRTVLIEKGILKGYMQDRLSSILTGTPATGNGRRESYASIPMPRMTNTFMLPGQWSQEEIIKTVDRGLLAVHFGGGQVDITNGNFVFSASEAYLIENGRVTAPVKGATLVGSGPEVLTRVSMVGNDLSLDEGIGTCGKEGQNVPVGVGLPTIRVDALTVGGTGA